MLWGEGKSKTKLSRKPSMVLHKTFVIIFALYAGVGRMFAPSSVLLMDMADELVLLLSVALLICSSRFLLHLLYCRLQVAFFVQTTQY